MPRNRMIKPEFWGDEKLSVLSDLDRLFYIGMWNFSDDYGVIKGNVLWLKSQVFPYDERPIEVFRKSIESLKKMNRLIPFSDKGENYFYMPKFLEHQKIDKPSKSRNAVPPDDVMRALSECSPNTLRILEDEAEAEKEVLKEAEKEHLNGSANGTLNAEIDEKINNLLSLPFQNDIHSCLKFYLKKFEVSEHPNADAAREKMADDLTESFNEAYLWRKIKEFAYLSVYAKKKLGNNPAAHLIARIKDDYEPPSGFDEWVEQLKLESRS